jgi:hypothetical protein
MPLANLIQSAKRWRGTAITTGMSALKARSIRVRKALSLALLPPEPVDDHEVGSPIDRAGDLGAGVRAQAALYSIIYHATDDPATAAGRASAGHNRAGRAPLHYDIFV